MRAEGSQCPRHGQGDDVLTRLKLLRLSHVLDALEAVVVNALLLQRPDHALHHAVLLRAVRGDELLSQTITSDQCRVMAASKNQSIVRPQQELTIDAAQGSEAANQGMLQCAGARGCLALNNLNGQRATCAWPSTV